MAIPYPERGQRRQGLTWKLMASAAILCAAGACTKTDKAAQRYVNPSINITNRDLPPAKPTDPLVAATTYWAQEHQKKPRDPKAALNYARNLKALGANDKAMEVLDETYRLNPKNTEIASEYGRLALAANKLALADSLLKRAEQASGGGDWRVLSARGTLLAKRGDHQQAQGYFLAALRQQPGAVSVRNNLALSYAMSGQPQEAEKLLSEVVKSGRETPRIRQNLALVMGLEGKYEDAKRLASVDMPEQVAKANMTYLNNMVRPAKAAQAVAANQAVPAPVPAHVAALPRPAAPAARATSAATPKPAAPPAPPVVLTAGHEAATGAQQTGGWTTTVEPATPEPAPRNRR